MKEIKKIITNVVLFVIGSILMIFIPVIYINKYIEYGGSPLIFWAIIIMAIIGYYLITYSTKTE